GTKLNLGTLRSANEFVDCLTQAFWAVFFILFGCWLAVQSAGEGSLAGTTGALSAFAMLFAVARRFALLFLHRVGRLGPYFVGFCDHVGALYCTNQTEFSAVSLVGTANIASRSTYELDLRHSFGGSRGHHVDEPRPSLVRPTHQFICVAPGQHATLIGAELNYRPKSVEIGYRLKELGSRHEWQISRYRDTSALPTRLTASYCAARNSNGIWRWYSGAARS